MSKAPEKCLYCQDGTGRSERQPIPNECGFCENGKPLDTQEDWDNSWGKLGQIDFTKYPCIKLKMGERCPCAEDSELGVGCPLSTPNIS